MPVSLDRIHNATKWWCENDLLPWKCAYVIRKLCIFQTTSVCYSTNDTGISTILHCVLFYSCIQNIPGYNNDKIVCSTKHWMDAVSTKCDFHPLACLHRNGLCIHIHMANSILSRLTECFIFGWSIELHAEKQ